MKVELQLSQAAALDLVRHILDAVKIDGPVLLGVEDRQCDQWCAPGGCGCGFDGAASVIVKHVYGGAVDAKTAY